MMPNFETLVAQERMEHRWPFLVVCMVTPLAFLCGLIGWHVLLGLFLMQSVIGR